jgi:hypothetical protein
MLAELVGVVAKVLIAYEKYIERYRIAIVGKVHADNEELWP